MITEGSRRIAVVTGASRGIGAATAMALAARGIVPVLAVRRPDAAGEVVRALAGTGVQVDVLRCDVASAGDVAALVAAVVGRHGRLDAIINNAGQIAPIARIAETDPLEWAAGVQTNLVGPYHLIRAALPHLARARGTVVNVSTGAAHAPREGWSAYCASKAGLAMLTMVTHHEYGGEGVSVYGFQPGVVDTDMQGTIRQSGINEISRIPRSKLAPPERAAAVIAWLVHAQPTDLRGNDLSIADQELVARASESNGTLGPDAASSS